jgi:hypothetical protein
MKSTTTLFIVIAFFLVGCSAPGSLVNSNDPSIDGAKSLSLKTTVAPGGNFNLSIWQLQLPSGTTNNPDTYTPAQLAGPTGYTSAYFYTDPTDGAMTLMDCQDGVTTSSSSSHCRSELREMNTDGTMAAWAPTGTNTLTVTGVVTLLGSGSSGKTTIGQIFDSNTSKPMIELEFDGNGAFRMLLENTSAGGKGVYYPLSSVAIGSQYTYTLSFTGTTITVTTNGNVYTFTPDTSFTSGDKFYFKCGNYDQTATNKGKFSTTPYTVVKNYSIVVVHSSSSSSTSVSSSSSSSVASSSSSSVASSSSSSVASSSSSSSSPAIPAAPTKLKNDSATTTTLTMSWAAPTGTVIGYKLYRSLNSNGPFDASSLVDANIASSTYTDAGLVTGTKYYYVVTAFNGSGESQQSGSQKGKTN